MLTPAETSYFSAPAAGLDPRLFQNGKLKSEIRNAVLQLLTNFVSSRYSGSSGWMTAWLAGSGVSYQWAAHRDPGDLDCLVGVDFPRFREANLQFVGLSDKEISQMFNEEFSKELHPKTDKFMGSFELTFYVNTKTNILDIKPYAAYSLFEDSWTVMPGKEGPSINPDWEIQVEKDRKAAIDVLTKYINAKSKYDSAGNDAVKANARAELKAAMVSGATLYDTIHAGRKYAFGDMGQGYLDFNNYRWQAGKRSGVVQGLKKLKETLEKETKEFEQKTYGTEIPDARVLVRRAATYRSPN